MLNLLRQRQCAAETHVIEHIARTVHLSRSRLRHLFNERIGLSLQRYVLWSKVMHPLESAATGITLTDVAYSAGFADSAHLARVFRATFGLSTSEIFKRSHSVQVTPCYR